MSTTTLIGYAAAGVIVAASAVTATLATFGLGGSTEATSSSPVATASAEQALVTTPGGPTITLALGEQIASSQVVQTPAEPVEYLYVIAAPARGYDKDDDDDDDEHQDRSRTSGDDHDDGDDDDREDRRESRSSVRGARR